MNKMRFYQKKDDTFYLRIISRTITVMMIATKIAQKYENVLDLKDY